MYQMMLFSWVRLTGHHARRKMRTPAEAQCLLNAPQTCPQAQYGIAQYAGRRHSAPGAPVTR